MPAVVAAALPILEAIGTFLFGLGYFIYSLSDSGFFELLGSIEWSAMFKWLHTAQEAQMAPQLPFGNEALHEQFQQFMNMQFQIGELKRQMLTMPALPTEGF